MALLKDDFYYIVRLFSVHIAWHLNPTCSCIKMHIIPNYMIPNLESIYVVIMVLQPTGLEPTFGTLSGNNI
jgi:hypothetical protein